MFDLFMGHLIYGKCPSQHFMLLDESVAGGIAPARRNSERRNEASNSTNIDHAGNGNARDVEHCSNVA